MNLTRVALTVGLAWVAANLLLKTRRAARAEPDDGLSPLPSMDPGLPVRVRALTGPPDAVTSVRSGAPGFARGA